MHLDTLSIHAGRAIDRSTGAVSLPLHTSTTFERAADGGFPTGFEYVRDGNPTRNAFEAAMATLEGGASAMAFASGMAAISAVIDSLDRDGRIIAPDDMYFGIRSLIDETDIGRRFDFCSVDMTNLDALRAELDRERASLVWIETPSNPLIRVVDVASACAMAHEVGALAVVDNTWSTPVLQRPLELGADAVIHSATKYVGGHSDLMAGIVVVPNGSPLERPLRMVQRHRGSIAAPFDCWLALRGLQTLPLRMRAHCAGALEIALALSREQSVESVLYPGLPDDPGHSTARRQMSGFGGMLSFVVRGGAVAAMTFAAKLNLITRATSLGGTHSLIEHRASVEGPRSVAPPGLLRLSVGLEHPEDLLADLRQALAGLN
jgi:cystathionine gamma-synthase